MNLPHPYRMRTSYERRTHLEGGLMVRPSRTGSGSWAGTARTSGLTSRTGSRRCSCSSSSYQCSSTAAARSASTATRRPAWSVSISPPFYAIYLLLSLPHETFAVSGPRHEPGAGVGRTPRAGELLVRPIRGKGSYSSRLICFVCYFAHL